MNFLFRVPVNHVSCVLQYLVQRTGLDYSTSTRKFSSALPVDLR